MSAPTFQFISDALDEDRFTVTGFTGTEGISRLYRYEIELKAPSDTDIDLDEVLNSNARLITWYRGEDHPVHGMLASFDESHTAHGYTHYRAVLVPRLWRLSLYRSNEIYTQEKTVDNIVAAVLEGNDFIQGSDYVIDIQSNELLQRDYVCQFRESDYDFIARLLEYEGIYFYFEQNDSEEKLIITDDASYLELENGQLYFDPAPQGARYHQAVTGWSCRKQRQPASVTVRDYNPEQPSLEVAGRQEIDTQGLGEDYLYGETIASPEQANYLARLRAEQRLTEKTRFHGESGACTLRSGYSFSLQQHPNSRYNERHYLLIDIHHEALHLDHSGEGEHIPQYRNSFTAIDAALPYRPPLLTPKPRFHGTMTAFIHAEAGGDLAEVDDQGRYRVLLPFDRAGNDASERKASAWIRMATPYAGRSRGMYFPMQGGTEVLLTFINGDPDRPVIAAALPNASQPALLTSANTWAKINIVTTLQDIAGNRHIISGTTSKADEQTSEEDPPEGNMSDIVGSTPINDGLSQNQPGDMRPPWSTMHDEWKLNASMQDTSKVKFFHYTPDFKAIEITQDHLDHISTDRSGGDSHGYRNGRTFYYPQHERVYFIGTFHEDFHLKDDFTDPDKSWTGQREVFHFPEPGGNGDQGDPENPKTEEDINPRGIRGVTEDKRWGDQMFYAWGRSFNWGGGPGPGGSFQQYNYGNSYTENLLEQTGGTSEQHYPHNDYPRQDLYKDYAFFDPAKATIDKTFGNTFSYQNGASIDIKEGRSIAKTWGNSEEEIYGDQSSTVHGNQSSTVKGDQWSRTEGRDDSMFFGGKSELSIAGSTAMELGPKSSFTSGASLEMSLAVKSEFSLGASFSCSLGPSLEYEGSGKFSLKPIKADKTETEIENTLTKINNRLTKVEKNVLNMAKTDISLFFEIIKIGGGKVSLSSRDMTMIS